METKEIKLTDVCDFQGGTQPPKEEWIDEQREGYVRMLQIRDFTQGKAEHVEFVKDTKKLNKCKTDDILIGRYGASVGKILTGLEGAYNVAIIKTIPDETKLLKKYLYYVLTGISFQNFISRIGARAAQAGFNKDDLTYFKLHLPSLENQERIANILSKAEELIGQRGKSIYLLDDLIKFSFKKMFGNPILNEKNWDLKTLETITTKITDGKHGDCINEENSRYYFISAKDLVNGKIEYKGVREITKKDFEETHKRTRLELNDILIGNTGASIGKIAFVVDADKASRTTFQKSIAIVTTNNTFITAKFLRAYLQANREHLDRISSGSGQKNLLLSQLRSLKIIIPPLELQNKFVTIVEQIESMKVDYERSKIELEKLFASLGQKAFRGELNIIESIEIKGTIKIKPKISAEVIVIDKINKELSDFHNSIPHSGASDDIDNTLRHLDAELKIKGEIPFTENYVKYRLIKEKQTAPFTFEKLWKEITEFPFETAPDYDEFSELLFEWLGEKNSFIRQQYNEITKQTELVLNETAKA